MTREWKPGDMADVTSAGNVRAFRTDKGWTYVDGSTQGLDADHYAFRPLVVIDPEDREQVKRLTCAIFAALPEADVPDIPPGRCPYWSEALPYAMQAALREFANPTAPEPRNDGALIECDYDGKHGRAVRLGGSWTFYGDALRDGGAIYEDFTNVCVLSEGVEVDR